MGNCNARGAISHGADDRGAQLAGVAEEVVRSILGGMPAAPKLSKTERADLRLKKKNLIIKQIVIYVIHFLMIKAVKFVIIVI